MGRMIGYARVSTEDQTERMQVDALMAHGIARDQIFVDKASGSTMDRKALKAAIRCCYRGDVLVVWKMDRLGRSVRGVLDAIENLEKAGVGLKSLTEPIDTTTAWGKMVMTVLLALAEMERNLISERTKEGVKAAKKRGVRFGQPHRILDVPKRLERFTELWKEGRIPNGMTGREIVEEMNRADPKARKIGGTQAYYNWKAKGFPGFDLPADKPLDQVEPEQDT